MLITQKSHQESDSYLDFIVETVKLGVTTVQLREKNLSFNELLTFGQKLHKRLKSLQIPLIINDNLALCIKLGAEGLHLGQTDGDVIEARKALGPSKIIGQSVDSMADISQANHLPLDYIGVGAIFPTKNKKEVSTLWGIEGLKQAVKYAVHPIIALGGINSENASLVIQAGASGIAAIGFFHDKPPETTPSYLHAFN